MNESTISWLRQAGGGRDEGGTTLAPAAVAAAPPPVKEAAAARVEVDNGFDIVASTEFREPSLALLGSFIAAAALGERRACACVCGRA